MRFPLSALTLCLALVSCLVAPTAQAQMTFGLNPGARVRVKSAALGEGRSARRVARIVAVSTDSMVFQIDGRAESVALRRRDVITLDGFAGRQSNTVSGLKYGTLGGIAFGALLGAASGSWSSCGSDGFCGIYETSTAENVTYGAIGFGILGMLGGAAGGALTRSDRWQALAPSEWASRVTVAQKSSRELALRVTF